MRLVSNWSENFLQNQYKRLAEYRHQVFVERLGWEDLRSESGLEMDQFDRNDTIYIVAEEDDGHIVGCARLLPTTKPYLLGEVFPQLYNGLSPPCSPDVWELSRFSALDINKRNASSSQVSSPIARQLLEESISCAVAQGAKRLITVSPLGIERLLLRSGFNSHRAGPPVIISGHPTFACWIDLE